MFCSNCGKQSEGSNFCPYCGSEMHRNVQQPMSAPETPRTRSKRRAWVFIVVAAGVVIAAAAVLFFVLTHAIEGQWYSEERGEVMVFNKGGTINIESLFGYSTADFIYDRITGRGSCNIGGKKCDLTAGASKIDIGGIGVFKKTGDNFNVDKFLDDYGYLGTWYSEERGEVLVFNRDGVLQSKHMAGVNNAEYVYDRKKETGEIIFEPFSYDFEINNGQMSIDGMGVFIQAESNFDAEAFLRKFGYSALGIWYDIKGEGVIDLHADGTYDMFTFGRNLKGTYTYTGNDITITFKCVDLDFDITYLLRNTALKHDGVYMKTFIDRFVRGYNEQKGKEHFYDEAVGVWVSESIEVTVEFFNDGTGIVYNKNGYYTGTYEYEPVGNVGYFSVVKGSKMIFVIMEGDTLLLDGSFFYRK